MPAPAVCPALQLSPAERQQIALDVLSGAYSVSFAAQEHDVSRKFVYHQVNTARDALQDAFDPEPSARDDEVLFSLPVSKPWIRQFVLALVLIGHCSYRGVTEILRDLFDYSICVGTVHNIVCQAVSSAETINSRQELSTVFVGAHDEIFHCGDPILVGVDVHSTYCYLLSAEAHRDGDTWGVCILDLRQQGFDPDSIVGDAGTGMRSGQRQAIASATWQGDVFHVLYETTPLCRFLDNRAYDAIAALDKLQREQARADSRQQTRSKKPAHVQATESTPSSEAGKEAKGEKKASPEDKAKQLDEARQTQRRAIELADEVRLLVNWLHYDVLGMAGPDHPTRCELYDFIVAELKAREEQCPHRIRPVRRMLENQRTEVLAFAAKLDGELAGLASKLGLPVTLLREMHCVQEMAQTSCRRWQRDAWLWEQLGSRYREVQQAVAEVAKRVVRASSVVENLNSRLRSYFFLRRQLGQGYLGLLRFFLNHRRFMRSEHPERAGKSPAELLSGQEHPHWLEMLGFKLFRRG